MEKVTAVIVAKVNTEEKEALDYYISHVGQLYEEVGAKTVAKHKIKEAFIGQNTPDLVIVMEFNDQKAFDNVFKSEAYQALLPYRDKAFTSLEAYVS